MIDVLPGVLTEDEIGAFDMMPTMWDSLRNIINIPIANMIQSYLNNTEANAEIQQKVRDKLYDVVKPYVMDKILKEAGVFDTIHENRPYYLDESSNLTAVINSMDIIYAEYGNIKTELHSPTNDDFMDFLQSLDTFETFLIINAPNVLTHKDMRKRVIANKTLYYTKDDTNLSMVQNIVRRKQDWEEMYKGAKYMRYCNMHGIHKQQREVF